MHWQSLADWWALAWDCSSFADYWIAWSRDALRRHSMKLQTGVSDTSLSWLERCRVSWKYYCFACRARSLPANFSYCLNSMMGLSCFSYAQESFLKITVFYLVFICHSSLELVIQAASAVIPSLLKSLNRLQHCSRPLPGELRLCSHE